MKGLRRLQSPSKKVKGSRNMKDIIPQNERDLRRLQSPSKKVKGSEKMNEFLRMKEV
jgi:hypothetical protein